MTDEKDKTVPEIFRRLKAVEDKVLVADTRLIAVFSTGIFFWGITSYFIYGKLEQIDRTIELANTLDRRTALLEFRQNHQETLNQSFVQEQERIRTNYSRLQERVNRLQFPNTYRQSEE